MNNELLDKYEDSIKNNLDKENVYKIITFLVKEKCEYIEDLLTDYLDIFTIEYNDFIKKYNELKKKYGENIISIIEDNLNILEELL